MSQWEINAAFLKVNQALNTVYPLKSCLFEGYFSNNISRTSCRLPKRRKSRSRTSRYCIWVSRAVRLTCTRRYSDPKTSQKIQDQFLIWVDALHSAIMILLTILLLIGSVTSLKSTHLHWLFAAVNTLM